MAREVSTERQFERNAGVHLWNILRNLFSVLGRSGVNNPGKYLLGKDGWIFLDRDTNEVVRQMTGGRLLDDAGLDAWTRIVAHRRDLLARRGTKFFFMVAPNKKAIYPEYLPDGIEITTSRPVFQLEAALRNRVGVSLIYPDRELHAAKGRGYVYPKTDTHWSGLGGYVAYKALAGRMRADGVPLHVVEDAEFDFVETEVVGDLGVKLTPERRSPTPSTRLRAPRSALVYDNRITNRGRMRVFRNQDRSLPTCVMFGDSFGGNLLAFFRESFGTFVYIYGNVIDEEILDQFQPDVVVTEMVERFLISPPDEFGSIRNRAIVSMKIETLPEGELPGIEEAFTKAVEGGWPHARFQLGVLYHRQRRFAEAESMLRAAVAETPDNAQAFHLLAKLLTEHGGDLDDAARVAERSVALEPNHASYHHLLALVRLRQRRPDAAAEALRRAISLSPDVPWWRYQLAQALFRQEKWEEARTALSEYMKLAPASADAFQLLGRIAAALGETTAAVNAFRRSADLRPDWAWPRLKVAQTLFQANMNLGEAANAIEQALPLFENQRERSEGHLLKAQILAALGRKAEARAAADACLCLRPDWDWARSFRDRLADAAA